MSTEPCHIPSCARALGHAGAHTAAPSARTLDWDTNRAPIQTEQIKAAVDMLIMWAALNADQ